MNTDPRFEQLISDGLTASREGRTDAALALFAEAGALVPASGIPPFLIASEEAGAGNMDAAEAAFANAVLLEPAFTLARYQLGLLQFSSKRAAVALLTWQPLFELPESDALLHFVRGFAELAQDHFQEAQVHYHVGLRSQDANPAVAADIMKVVEKVEQLLGGPQDPAPPGAGEEEAANHFLLGGYAKGLH